MAFHDVQLPTNIERGARGGPRFRTGVVTTISGYENRNAEWSQARQEWDLGYGIQTNADYSTVRDFFYARRGKLHGFRFKDWSDYSVTGQSIGTGDGVETDFQLVKSYTDSGGTYTRTILLPVTSPTNTVTVYVNAVEQTIITDYTIETGGIIRFTGGSIPTAGQPVTADFEFDIPVRFDVDNFDLELEWVEAGAIPSIPIKELRQIT